MRSTSLSILAISLVCLSTAVACDKPEDKPADKPAADKPVDKAGSGKTVQAIGIESMEDGKQYTRDLAFVLAQEVSGSDQPILLHFDDADKVRVNMYPAEGLAYDKLERGTVYSVTFDHSKMGMPVAKKVE